ncbi:MAG: hypothetical protein L0Z50_40420, partial [Verrucomicrobiales bacterium]|nr:hypothetical protein [Verrucomicrobiales bacterium]
MTNNHVLDVAVPAEQQYRGAQEVSFRSPADWVAESKTVFAHGRASTFELAKVVYAAKRRLPFGDWAALCRSGQLPFARRKGYELVAVGKGLGNLNVHDRARLPSALKALYHLARLDRRVLADFIIQRVIHPALTVKQAKDLLVSRTPKSQDKSKDFPIKRWLARLRKQVQTRLPGLSESGREMAASALQQLAQEITTYGHATAVRHDRSAVQSISRREPRGSCSDREPSRFAARSVEESHQGLQASSHVRSAADGDRPRSAAVAATPQRAADSQKAAEGATDGIDALAAVGIFVGLGQESGRDELAEELFEVEQALLLEALHAPAQGGEA